MGGIIGVFSAPAMADSRRKSIPAGRTDSRHLTEINKPINPHTHEETETYIIGKLAADVVGGGVQQG